jgi:apolipoprotein N-acyltransferase
VTFADGWVCQSCWKPNRPQDTRCYRCKTERGADKATIEARQQERKQDVTRRERVPDIVTLLPATVFAWYGRLTLLSGVLLLLLTPLILGNPEAPDGILVIWLGFAFGILAAGIAMRWASGAMRSSNPWAFALALVASVALVAMTLYAMNALPQGVGNPTWMRYILVGAFGLSAILAMVGLLFSLTGDQPEGPVDNA